MSTGDKSEVGDEEGKLLSQYLGSDLKMRTPEEHVKYLIRCAAEWRYYHATTQAAKDANEVEAKRVEATANRIAALIRTSRREGK